MGALAAFAEYGKDFAGRHLGSNHRFGLFARALERLCLFAAERGSPIGHIAAAVDVQSRGEWPVSLIRADYRNPRALSHIFSKAHFRCLPIRNRLRGLPIFSGLHQAMCQARPVLGRAIALIDP
jgi:hypothetical protein